MARSKINILLDTNCFIYAFEGSSVYVKDLKILFKKIQTGDFSAIVSVLSLSELLVLPFRLNKQVLAEKYKTIMTTFPNLKMIEITNEIAVKAAELRAKYSIKTPDALILATGILNDVNNIVTFDEKLLNICIQENILPFKLSGVDECWD